MLPQGAFSVFCLCLLVPVHGKILKSEVLSSESFIRKELKALNMLEELQFAVFGSLFVLAVRPNDPSIQSNCLLTYYQENTRKVFRVYDLDITHYVGKVIGDNRSRVTLMDSSKLYYGTIESERGNIIFQPVLLSDSHSYQGDILFMLVDEPISIAPEVLSPVRIEDKKKCKRFSPFRSKRETNTSSEKSSVLPEELNRCNVTIVVDHNYSNGQNVAAIYGYVNTMMTKVNEIFMRTDFDDGVTDEKLMEDNRGRYVGMGMQVISIDILPPNDSNTSSFEYSGDLEWDLSVLRDSFEKSDYCKNTCLCHLITGKKIDDSARLGVSRIGGKNTGICNNQNALVTRAPDNSSDYDYLKSFLVAAHEYGHTWGSNHDSSEKEYLLHTIQVNGFKASHYTFSPESKKKISKIITSATDCFVRPSLNVCGNGVLEKPEECDSGKSNVTTCCTENCTLEHHAKCSPLHHACCTEDCGIHKNTRKCRDAVPEICEDETFCNGFDYDCPLPKLMNNTACYGNGTCNNGTCHSYCKMNGKDDCTCDGKSACLRCCKDENGVCSLEPNLLLPDNASCGTDKICRNGECIPVQKKEFSRSTIGGYSWITLSGVTFLTCCILHGIGVYVIRRHDQAVMKGPRPSREYTS